MIAANGITVRRAGQTLLDDVSLLLKPGSFHCILGPNGAGKSTLLKAICGEITPDKGAVFLNARPVHAYAPLELAARRGVLSQHTELTFAFTTAEVVALGVAAQVRSRALTDWALTDWALHQVGMAAKADQPYPTLSGGEKQRAHLARVLVQLRSHAAQEGMGERQPQYLILDEPTASLDLAYCRQVLEIAVAAARSGLGVLAVLHDLNEAMRYADLVTVLAKGRVVAAGAPVDVITADLVEAVYGVPAVIAAHPGNGVPIVALT